MATETPDLSYALRAIYLRACNTRMGEGFDPTTTNELIGEFRVLGGEAECRTLDAKAPDGVTQVLRTCVFTTRFEFRYLRSIPGGEAPIVAAEITAEITSDYLCTTQEFPEESKLHAWGKSNVLLHAWPYWREFCHNMLARMQLPVTLIPLARLDSTKPEPTGLPKPRRTKKKRAE